MKSKKTYTIQDLIQTDNDELLLAKVLHTTREHVLAYSEKQVSQKDFKKFKALKSQALKGVPLAYLMGEKWFFGSKFFVNTNVLIPRPETEQLVELAIKSVKTEKPAAVIDIGTGSGAIIVSVAKAAVAKPPFFASDISPKALAVAKQNAKNILGKENTVTFKKGSLLVPFLKSSTLRSNLLILSNLPYLSRAEMKEPTIKFEPKSALLGGRFGDEIIKELINDLAENKIRASKIILEIGYAQGKKILGYTKKTLPNSKARTYKDLSNLDRIIEIKIN